METRPAKLSSPGLVEKLQRSIESARNHYSFSQKARRLNPDLPPLVDSTVLKDIPKDSAKPLHENRREETLAVLFDLI